MCANFSSPCYIILVLSSGAVWMSKRQLKALLNWSISFASYFCRLILTIFSLHLNQCQNYCVTLSKKPRYFACSLHSPARLIKWSYYFLCTKQVSPTKADWKIFDSKLRRVVHTPFYYSLLNIVSWQQATVVSLQTKFWILNIKKIFRNIILCSILI